MKLERSTMKHLEAAVYDGSAWGNKLNDSISGWKATIPGGFVIEMPYTIVQVDSSPGGSCIIRDANNTSWFVPFEWIKDNPSSDPRPTPPDLFQDAYISSGSFRTITIPADRGVVITRRELDLETGGPIEQSKAASKANSIVDDVADIGRRLKELERRRL